VKSLDLIRDWPVDRAAAAVVTRGGTVASRGDLDEVYPLASVTKLLVAYAALVAIEEGAIELDQQAGPPGSTVRHLLAHASGLAFGEHRQQAPPETKRIYSSAGFEVLAELMEAETEIAFPEYLRQAVFEPLGMHASSLPADASAGHGAHSSVGDLARFAGELLDPVLISRETFADATSVQFAGLNGLVPGYGTFKPNDWGLGFEIRGRKNPHWTADANSSATFGHFGQSGTFLWVDPELGVSSVVLTNRAFGDWAKPLWPALGDAVITEFT